MHDIIWQRYVSVLLKKLKRALQKSKRALQKYTRALHKYQNIALQQFESD